MRQVNDDDGDDDDDDDEDDDDDDDDDYNLRQKTFNWTKTLTY